MADTYLQLKEKADAILAADVRPDMPVIQVALATCGIAAGALETVKAFEETVKELGVDAIIKTTGCTGHCYAEPVVVIDHPASGFPPLMYQEVSPGKAKMLTKMFLQEYDPRLEHVFGAMVENELLPTVMDFPRFGMEKRIVMGNCGEIDPDNIAAYIAKDGYAALTSVLEKSSASVMDVIDAAKLRGRGGAGYPAAAKWRAVLDAHAEEKWVICNADEGDPGAYMDRMLLESDPHRIIEGMLICAKSVGATHGAFYVRAEYPLAVETLTKALQQAREWNVLGDRILESDFSFDIRLFEGSGAFVCGEETALLQSMMGHRGMPTVRPPYPAEKGLNGTPTVVNNVKTLAMVPSIFRHGAEWFLSIGTAESPGTAIFSVVGDVVYPGLVEVPMGITLRELIYDVCGGIPSPKTFKSIQIGGPSGGCLGEKLLDTPIDFDSLTSADAMMGSGGLVVMANDTCPVNVARYFLDFTQKESCGKCTFCRIGTRHLLEILDRITEGEGRIEDIIVLEEISSSVQKGSLCGLGKTATNPVLTALAHFSDEFEEHIVEHKCRGHVCRKLIAFYIDLDACARGCDACVGSCPTEAIFTTSTRKKGIDQDLCVKCGECVVACPPEYDAVRRISPAHLVPIIENPAKKPVKE